MIPGTNRVIDCDSPVHREVVHNLLLDEKDYSSGENDSTSDDDDHQQDFYTSHQYSGTLSLPPIKHLNPMLYFLGRTYDPINDYTIIRDDDCKHLIWLTYRSEFEEIAPYGIKSDAG
jgi:hypothetical protein